MVLNSNSWQRNQSRDKPHFSKITSLYCKQCGRHIRIESLIFTGCNNEGKYFYSDSCHHELESNQILHKPGVLHDEQ
jgi:hypothetical protein